ncbi:putative GPI anchored protein [Aspergillus ibericus CBS 121593]|uniref:GPI anchored protein n=1 Tax=Aspergillus ibericus CBS 121593 TaxID=1448316 RepID=A0A395GZ21_9EURO|nr:GPI anchored protein [Aspergillus ibericus CBS 121593]RAL00329.1 GPI anchored protein [Aspergillus ibericus CBS 121593]
MLFAPLLACVLGPSIAGQALASNISISNDPQHADAILQHNALIESYLSQKPVRGVRKMTDDESEKFFLDYWLFDEAYTAGNTSDIDGLYSQLPPSINTTEKVDFQPRSYPFRPSYPSDLEVERRGWSEHFSPLLRREFKCPTGTYSCTSIDRADSCCSTSDTCVLVNDTGSGDVGCCPTGDTCSGTIGSCQDGYASCSSSLGGGCCIPGYECVTGGCDSTVMLSTSTHTIPATTATQSTGDLVPPARPTSVSTSTNSETTKTTSTASVCPTGFYACSAVYQGGCCRTGRNCDTTDCPATPSTTFTSDGVTIVVPVATTTDTTTALTTSKAAHCASGWFSCAATVGGGCCPTGYQCGSSCTAVSTATQTVAKEQATSGSEKLGWQRGMVGMGLLVALGI